MLTFYDLALKIIEEEKRPLSAAEIWDLAVKKGYDTEVSSKGKTPWQSIGSLIYVDIRDNRKSKFIKASTRPTKFYLKSLIKEKGIGEFTEEELSVDIEQRQVNYSEKDIHPFLVYFASSYFKAFAKTINHSTSTKKEFGEWVHPDIVACYFPIEDWNNEVYELSEKLGDNPVKLYSFELKKTLTFSNLRESFFQAVSNSSWANEGYLVASEISKDDDFIIELKRLSTSFGIGIIKIEIDDPDSSEILFPAKNKNNLDWDTINKLTMNSDFKEFIKRLKNDLVSKEIRKEKFDKVLTKEGLIKRISAE